MSELKAIADQFGKLPLQFMNFHGGSDLEDVIEAMDFAVYQHDVEHIIIDNLQFMMPRSGSQRAAYRYVNVNMCMCMCACVCV